MYHEDDKHRWVSLQTQADVSTFICAICFFFLIYVLENPPSGGAALGVIFPFIIVVILHLSLGLHALMSAISTNNVKRNLWIYLYFLSVVLITLGYMGLYNSIARNARASIETYQHPVEHRVFSAIENISATELESAISDGANLHYCFEHVRYLKGLSALQYSVKTGNQRATELVLDAGAGPDYTCLPESDSGPTTALNMAAYDKDTETVQRLLAKGADPNLSFHGTPLGHAISVNRSLPSPSGNYGQRTSAEQEQVRQVVLMLIESGADVNQEHHNYSPLLRAIAVGDRKLVAILVEQGADISIKGKENESAVYLAARYGHPEILQQLLNRYQPRLDDIDAFLAVRAAGRNRDKRSMDLLLASGLKLGGFYDPTFMKVERARLYPSIDSDDELAEAIKSGNWMYVDALLAAGLDFERNDGDGTPQVIRFASDAERLEKLVDRGADLNVSMYGGATPMHHFATCKHCRNPIKAMENLVAQGALINAEDDRGRTPLYAARRAKLRDTVTYLESLGAIAKPDSRQ